VKEPINNKK